MRAILGSEGRPAVAGVTAGVVLLAGLAAAGPGAKAQQTGRPQELQQFVAVEAPVVVLRNVKVIDGTGAPAKENQTIVIRGERIASVEPSAGARVPEDARVLDLAGHTVIPGLVGLHNHSYYTAAGGRAAQLSFSGPRLYLAAGVTTIRTTGARHPYEELNLKREIDAGRVIGPTMFTTGPYLTGQRGSLTMTRLNGPEDARRVVRYWAEEGVSWFKAYTEISRAELAAAIEEAHKHGVKVTAHLCSVTYSEAVDLGIDNLEHGLFANSEYYPDKRPDECPPGFLREYENLDIQSEPVQRTIRRMVERGVAMTSTLVVYEISVRDRPPIDERVFEVLAPEIARDVRAVAEQRRKDGLSPAILKKAMEFEYAFAKAGGLLAAGVDPTGYGAAPPGLGDQRNFELLLEAGFTPVEVVQIMSANGAKVLGISDSVGTVEAGKIADLVVIQGDPEREGHIRNVRIVFRRGVGWDSQKLIESVKGIVGIR
ncbi:Imidazolonepropionase [bacterium HR33]|nr:Imidazolonepropionase [bacterium HR33]